MKPVPFTVHPSDPTRIVIKGADGQDYEMHLQLVVTGVIDNESYTTAQTPSGPIKVPSLSVNTSITYQLVVAETSVTPVTPGGKISTGNLN